MKKQALIIATLSVLCCACTKELDCPVTEETGASTFHLSLSLEETKTTVSSPDGTGKRTVLWKAGDKITLNGVESDALDEQYDSSKTANFTFQSVVESPYKILYPSSMYVDDSHICLPAVQEAMPGDDDFASGTVPMAGYAESANASISMKQLCAAVKIQWKQAETDPDLDDILYVEFKGGNGEQVSGKFSIDYAAATLTGSDDGYASKTVRTFSGKSESAATCVTNIVIPAGTYTKGFTVRLVDVNGHYMEKSVTSPRTFEAGTVASFPVIEFVPTGTILVIDTKEKLIAWGKGTDFKAAGDEVVIAADIDMEGEAWTGFNFDGNIDGTGHSITNINVSGNSRFVNFLITVTGNISNLTFGSPTDNSVFSCTYSAAKAYYLAPIGGLSGTAVIDNVVSYAKLDYSGTSTGGTIYCGGVVGNVPTGTSVSNSQFKGSVTISKAPASYVNLGGIAAQLTGVGISSCVNSGTLDVKASFGLSLNFGGIVGYCAAASTIENCVNEGTVKMSATATPKEGQVGIGGILGYNSTTACTIKNCSNCGTVHKAAAQCSVQNYIGGIVGFSNVATVIDNCVNETAGVVKNTASCSGKHLYIGGIIGYAYGAPVITSSRNEGTVANTSTATYIYLGGIAGRSNSPVIGGAGTPCINSGTVSNTGRSSNAAANKSPNIAIGGITGWAVAPSITYCSNTGTVSNAGTLSTGKNTTTNWYPQAGNLITVGGIAAYASGACTIANCSNNSDKIVNSSKTVPARYCTGGILGYDFNTSMASFRDNTSEGTITVSGSAAYENNAGGIIGYVNGVAATITGCINKSALNSSLTRALNDTLATRITSGSPAYPMAMCLGGIIGKSTGALTLSSCTNEAKIYNSGITRVSGLNMGGILAYSGAESTVSACTNSGYILDYKSTDKTNGKTGQHYCIGGIVGRADAKITINGKCSNSGWIRKNTGTSTPAHKYQVGGIIASTYVAGSTIDDCSNSGAVDISASNVSGTSFCGGILANTAVQTAVSNCTNSGTISNISIGTYTYFGGIVGAFSKGASGASISGCENTGELIQTSVIASSLRMGGIIGDANGTYTLTNLVNRGNLSNTSATVADVRMGGIQASSTGDGSTTGDLTMSGCKNYGNITSTTTSGETAADTLTLKKGYFAGILSYKTNKPFTVTDCENYGNISVDATSAITSICLTGGVGYSTFESTISGGKICCDISCGKTPATAYIGQIVGYGTSTIAQKVGFGGSCNGTEITAENWNQTEPALAYGYIKTTTDNFDLSGGENSCYYLAPEK